jgi:DNA-binding transcriptional MerR regulator
MRDKANDLAKLSGVSTRTLRYYDQIGLLTPVKLENNGYRLYGQSEVDKLQQILFYRELGFALQKIKTIVNKPGFAPERFLECHLVVLQSERESMDALIANGRNTIIEKLATALAKRDPACEAAQEAAKLHREWLNMFWKDSTHSKQTHLALAEMYVSDARFTAFYDEKLGPGAAQMLRDAIAIYTQA